MTRDDGDATHPFRPHESHGRSAGIVRGMAGAGRAGRRVPSSTRRSGAPTSDPCGETRRLGVLGVGCLRHGERTGPALFDRHESRAGARGCRAGGVGRARPRGCAGIRRREGERTSSGQALSSMGPALVRPAETSERRRRSSAVSRSDHDAAAPPDTSGWGGAGPLPPGLRTESGCGEHRAGTGTLPRRSPRPRPGLRAPHSQRHLPQLWARAHRPLRATHLTARSVRRSGLLFVVRRHVALASFAVVTPTVAEPWLALLRAEARRRDKACQGAKTERQSDARR